MCWKDASGKKLISIVHPAAAYSYNIIMIYCRKFASVLNIVLIELHSRSSSKNWNEEEISRKVIVKTNRVFRARFFPARNVCQPTIFTRIFILNHCAQNPQSPLHLFARKTNQTQINANAHRQIQLPTAANVLFLRMFGIKTHLYSLVLCVPCYKLDGGPRKSLRLVCV